MTQDSIIIGERETNSIDLIRIAHGSYTLSRVAICSPNLMLTMIPNGIYLMHHTIEILIKSFLYKEEITIDYNKGKGHNFYSLIGLCTKKSSNLDFINQLFQDDNTKYLIGVLNSSYTKNKYSFAGYTLKTDELLDVYDKIIYTLLDNYWLLYGKKENLTKEQITIIWTTSDLIKYLEKGQKQNFQFKVFND
jgi:hypothetical protein